MPFAGQTNVEIGYEGSLTMTSRVEPGDTHRRRIFGARFCLAAVLLCVALCAVLMGLCGLYMYRGFEGTRVSISLPEFRKLTDLELPPSARLLHAELHDWRAGESVTAKLRLAKHDVNKLVKIVSAYPPGSERWAERPERVVSSTDRLRIDRIHDGLPDWWHPGSAQQFVAARVDYAPTTWMQLLIESDDAKEAIVYVYWFRE